MINLVALGDFIHKCRLSLNLLFHRSSRFRVEVEKYYLMSGDASMLSLFFFNTFEEGKEFAKKYHKPHYRIVLYEQGKQADHLCNIETGSWLTRTDEVNFNIMKDRYSFSDVLGVDQNGWYLRGLNTHNPGFTEVADDMESMLVEIKKRFNISNGKIEIEKVIYDVFIERHASLRDRYVRNFENWAIGMIEKEVLQKTQVLMRKGKECC